MQLLSNVSNDALLKELHAIVGSHRRATAELVVHLGEVDARRLHLDRGFSSLFSYCVEELRFSEDEAYRRIEAARLARRFPAVHPLLETGALSLTVLALLKPHLNDANHRELFALVSGTSARRAREKLAARFPAPDVPSTIRKLPERRSPPALPLAPAAPASMPTKSDPGDPAHDALRPAASRVNAEAGLDAASRVNAEPDLDAASPATLQVDAEPAREASPALRASTDPALDAPRPAPSPAPQARVEPLCEDRFLVKFTASRALKEKIELARDSMRHSSGALEVILERAIDLLLAELQKKQQGRTHRPRKEPPMAAPGHVTRAVRRDVVARDGWQCAFVSVDGRRCDARAFLEFDHVVPRGRGGGSRADNLRILCRAHNLRAAERA